MVPAWCQHGATPLVRGRLIRARGSPAHAALSTSIPIRLSPLCPPPSPLAPLAQLFATGVYRNQDQKDTKKQLLAIQKKVVAAAEKGDAAATSAAIKEFVAVGNIKDLTANPETTFDPKARRNAGAPKTSEILAQMGSEAYAFTTPLPPPSKK